VRILLADDHALFREGMCYVLSQLGDDIEVIQAENAVQAIDAAEEHGDIALVLLDLAMPGANGFGVLKQFRESYPALPIVVLSGSESQSDMQRVLDEGAMGFIPKSTTAPVMLSALQLVWARDIYIPPQLVEPSNGSSAGPSPDDRDVLTERQREILIRVVEGQPNKIIAAELGLTESTVKTHITSILKALGVRNRTQAARRARELGIISTAS